MEKNTQNLFCLALKFGSNFCGYVKSQNNSLSTLIHEVSLHDAMVLMWRAVSANRIDGPVNFWDNTFSSICCTNSNFFCSTTVRSLVNCSALFKQCYCERRGQKEVVLFSFVSSEPVRNLLVNDMKEYKKSSHSRRSEGKCT